MAIGIGNEMLTALGQCDWVAVDGGYATGWVAAMSANGWLAAMTQ